MDIGPVGWTLLGAGGTLSAIVEPNPEPAVEPAVALAGRRRAVPLATSSFFVAITIGGLQLVVQLYMKSIEAPTFLIGLVATFNSVGLLVGSWLWGAVSDHVRRRRLLAALCLGLSALVGLLTGLLPAAAVLGTAMLRFLFFAGLVTVSVAITSAASNISRRGKNLSYISSARALGFAVGNLSLGILLEILGFRYAFAVCAAFPLVALGSLKFLPSENPVRPTVRVAAWKAVFSAGVADLYVATMLRQMAIFGSFSLLYIYMDTLGIRPSLMGAASSTNTAAQVLAMLVFGRLADRIGRRPIFMLGFSLSVLTPIVFIFASDVPGMILGYITLGFAFSSMYVGATAHIGDRVPHERHGQMMGLFESSRGLGGLFGPLIAGATIPIIGFRGMFLVMAGIATIGLLVMVVGRLLHRRAGGTRAYGH